MRGEKSDVGLKTEEGRRRVMYRKREEDTERSCIFYVGINFHQSCSLCYVLWQHTDSVYTYTFIKPNQHLLKMMVLA